MICLTASFAAYSQSKTKKDEKVEQKSDGESDVSWHEVIKEKFVEGGPAFMGAVLICLILGLALAIERIIILNLSQINIRELLRKLKDALSNGGTDAASKVCSDSRGPVPAILNQGLSRKKEGVEAVEKSIISYGSIEMGKLESGMSWISLFITLAPLLGFMGTVYGMIEAFAKIKASGDLDIAEMAGGIQMALLTTIAGLIVAVILQIVYNYCVSKIDSLVTQMEEASTSFVDLLLEEELKNKKA